jgi:hypothetical protein
MGGSIACARSKGQDDPSNLFRDNFNVVPAA